MPTRGKTPAVPQLRTRDDMENCVRDICLLTIRQDELTAALNAEIAAVRQRFQNDLAAASHQLAASLAAAHAWAAANPAEFATRKSVAFVHGTVGYRTGTPKLKTFRGFTWDKVLDFLRDAFPEFVRIKAEIDKESIIAARDSLDPQALAAGGLHIVQDKTFFVEPKRDLPASAASPAPRSAAH